MTINDVTTDAQARMARSIDALRQELSKLRTGRATRACWTTSGSRTTGPRCR
jgi:ribosome recycling factor